MSSGWQQYKEICQWELDGLKARRASHGSTEWLEYKIAQYEEIVRGNSELEAYADAHNAPRRHASTRSHPHE
jgi:hypothetical protein